MNSAHDDTKDTVRNDQAYETMCQVLRPLEQQVKGVLGDAVAAKVVLSRLLLSIGIEDHDHLYFDGDCDGAPPHRQFAKVLAIEASDCPTEAPDVLDALGMMLIQTREYDRALRCYRKALELSPNSGYAHNNIAWCQLRLGDAEQATKPCEQALQLLGDHSHVHHDHASILYRLGKFDEAQCVIDHAVENLQPKAPQLLYLKACLLEQQGKKAEAVAAWKKYCAEVRSHYGHHRAVERALSHLDGLSQRVWSWRRNRLLRKVRPAQICIAPIWEFVGLDLPNEKRFLPSGDKWNSDIASAAATKGWKLLQRQRHAAARRKCDEALRVWPFSGVDRVLRARLALQEKDYKTYAKYVALANLEQMVISVGEPRRQALGEFVSLMILVHAEKAYHDGDYDAGLRQLDEVYRHRAEDSMVVFLRGLLLAAQGQKEAAKSLASKLHGDQDAVTALLRACRDEIPRMSASAASPLSSGPSFGTGGYSPFHRR